ncbi:hypothetical protein FGG78_15335 [Thioclava sp. BHET1]|nr:hypothetical protein FGG78_15335 [Thioclava sp. BHET1]
MFADTILSKVDKVVRGILLRAERPAGEIPAVNCTHMDDAESATERACVAVLRTLPEDEFQILALTYGLTRKAPKPPHRAADILGWGLARTMTIGEGALLHLRNNADSRAAFEPLLIALHLRLLDVAERICELRLSGAPRRLRDEELKQFWRALSPVERLCLRGYGTGERNEMQRALEKRAAGLIRPPIH